MSDIEQIREALTEMTLDRDIWSGKALECSGALATSQAEVEMYRESIRLDQETFEKAFAASQAREEELTKRLQVCEAEHWDRASATAAMRREEELRTALEAALGVCDELEAEVVGLNGMMDLRSGRTGVSVAYINAHGVLARAALADQQEG